MTSSLLLMMISVVVICRNSNRPVNPDEIEHAYSKNDNERVPCTELPDIDLQLWAERPFPFPHPPGYYYIPACSPSRGAPLIPRLDL